MRFLDIQYMECVNRAFSLLVVNGREYEIEQWESFHALLKVITEHFPFRPVADCVSQDELAGELETFLAFLRATTTDPVAAFRSRYGELVKKLAGRRRTRFQVAFPLSLAFTKEPHWRTFPLLGLRLERLTLKQWTTRFEEPARARTRLAPNFPDWTPHPHASFWKLTLAAGTLEAALRIANESILVFVGYTNYGGQRAQESHQRVARNRCNFVRVPPFVVARWGKRRIAVEPSQDRSKQPLVSWNRARTSRLHVRDRAFKLLGTSRPTHQRFAAAFRSYQEGLMAVNPEDAFRAFWRALEMVTMVRDSDPSITVTRRAFACITSSLPPDVIRHQAEGLASRRNQLVHRGATPGVAASEADALKIAFDATLRRAAQLRGWKREEDLAFLLDWLAQPMEMIERRRRELAGEIKFKANQRRLLNQLTPNTTTQRAAGEHVDRCPAVTDDATP